jgi:hypothetical protein
MVDIDISSWTTIKTSSSRYSSSSDDNDEDSFLEDGSRDAKI